MRCSLLALATVLCGLAIAAPQNCRRADGPCTIPAPTCASPGPQTTYLPEPCFPNTGVCYPTNYYAAQDQGQINNAAGSFDSQMMAKCKAKCDGQSQCAAFVGTENITPDGTLATGTCFFYSSQLVSPRQCADSPSRLIAYYKQKVCAMVTTTTTTRASTTTTTTKPFTTTTTTTRPTTTTTTTTKPITTTTTTTTKLTTTATSTTSVKPVSTTTTTSTTTSTTTTPNTTTTSSSTTSSTTTSSSTTSSSTFTTSSTTSSTTTSSSTTTTTTTTTTTSTTTTAAAPTCIKGKNFIMKAYNNPSVPDGSVVSVEGSPGDSQYIEFNTGEAAALFYFDASCHLLLTSDNEIANLDAGTSTGPLFFNTADQVSARGYQACIGALDANNFLSLTCGPASKLSLDTAGDVYIGNVPIGGTNPVNIQFVQA